MKNRVIAIILIVIILLVGYFGCKFLDKKESNDIEIALIEEEPKVEEVVEEVKEETKEKNTEKTEKSPSNSIKSTNTQKKVTKSVPKVSYDKDELKQYAHDLVLSYGWTENDYECLVKLINHESGWRVDAVNKNSGSCGLFQAYPCSKMSKYGDDYKTNYKTQMKFGFEYIKSRYGSPSAAWNFWQKNHWY